MYLGIGDRIEVRNLPGWGLIASTQASNYCQAVTGDGSLVYVIEGDKSKYTWGWRVLQLNGSRLDFVNAMVDYIKPMPVNLDYATLTKRGRIVWLNAWNVLEKLTLDTSETTISFESHWKVTGKPFFNPESDFWCLNGNNEINAYRPISVVAANNGAVVITVPSHYSFTGVEIFKGQLISGQMLFGLSDPSVLRPVKSLIPPGGPATDVNYLVDGTNLYFFPSGYMVNRLFLDESGTLKPNGAASIGNYYAFKDGDVVTADLNTLKVYNHDLTKSSVFVDFGVPTEKVSITGLKAANHIAAVSLAGVGVVLVDIRDYAMPKRIATLEGAYKQPAMQTQFIYLGSSSNVFEIYDLTSPSAPVRMASATLPRDQISMSGLVYAGAGLLFIGTTDQQFKTWTWVADVSDPRSPKIIGKTAPLNGLFYVYNPPFLYLPNLYSQGGVNIYAVIKKDKLTYSLANGNLNFYSLDGTLLKHSTIIDSGWEDVLIPNGTEKLSFPATGPAQFFRSP